MDTASAAGAAAIAGFSVWQMYEAYQRAAPSLDVLRRAQNAPDVLQDLVDADVTVGLVAVIAGSAASWLSGSYVPLAIVVVAFGSVALYHHLILADCDD